MNTIKMCFNKTSIDILLKEGRKVEALSAVWPDRHIVISYETKKRDSIIYCGTVKEAADRWPSIMIDIGNRKKEEVDA